MKTSIASLLDKILFIFFSVSTALFILSVTLFLVKWSDWYEFNNQLIWEETGQVHEKYYIKSHRELRGKVTVTIPETYFVTVPVEGYYREMDLYREDWDRLFPGNTLVVKYYIGRSGRIKILTYTVIK